MATVSGAREKEHHHPADKGKPAEEDQAPPRVTRPVFQRKCPEEQALRRTTLADLVRQATESKDQGASAPKPGEQGSSASGGGVGANMRKGPPAAADGPLRFSSGFECGNLLTAKMICPLTEKEKKGAHASSGGSSSSAAPAPALDGPPCELEYDLYTDNDTQSVAQHTQWFYFSVSTFGFQGTVTFHIVNLKKKKSLYQNGLQPHVYSVRRNRGWECQVCDNLSYLPNTALPKTRGSDIRADQHTLTFSYRCGFKDDEVYFASYPPYTYSMMQAFLARLDRHDIAKESYLMGELCRSIGQLPVPYMVVSQDVGKDCADAQESGARTRRPRPSVAVIARQHPGEVVGSWSVQGFIKFLLGPTPAARKLRETYIFHIVPMVNVDGVVHGNSRCTLAGVDPNRVWHDPNPIIHPVIYALKNHLRNMAQGAVVLGGPCKSLELFLDFHGHSAKFGCFFYGSDTKIHNALLPKLCATANTDFSFDQCHWRCSRSHKKTARYVVHKQFSVKYSYTMECSLFGPVPEMPGMPRSVQNAHGSGAGGGSSSTWVGRASEAPLSVYGGAATDDEASSGKKDKDKDKAEKPEKPPIFVNSSPKTSFTPNRVEYIGCAVARATAMFLNVDAEDRKSVV